MTLERLLDDPEDDFENALLRSAHVDVPSEADVQRGVLSIATLVLAASASVAGSGASGTHLLGTALSKHAALGYLATLKWVGIGVAAGLATAGGGVLVAHELFASRTTAGETVSHVGALAAPRRASITNPHQPTQTEAELGTAPTLVREEHASTLEEGPTGSESVGSSRRAAHVAPAETAPSRLAPVDPRTADRPTRMTAELAALSRARLALSAREPLSVLRELDEYDAMDRTHELDSEAFMMRLEALIQVGRAKAASRLAREYLSLHPRSAHRVRLEQIAGPP